MRLAVGTRHSELRTTGAAVADHDFLAVMGRRVAQRAAQSARELASRQIGVEQIVSLGGKAHTLVEASNGARLVVLGHRKSSGVQHVRTRSTSMAVAGRSYCPVVCVVPNWTPDEQHGRVVVGVEQPARAGSALKAAFTAAAQRKATLVVLHAWRLPNPYDEIIAARIDEQTWHHFATTTLERHLQSWRESFSQVKVEVDLRHQGAAAALLETSEDADLLVLGRRGHAAPSLIHLGSTTRLLIDQARCPVRVTPV